MNNNMFLVLVLVLLSGCSTVGSDHTPLPVDHTLQPIDCTMNLKREECLAVANLDKKMQKKAVKPAQSEQMERRARLAKIAENKRINDEKAKVKSEASSLAQDDTVVSKPDLTPQKKIDIDKPENAFAASMGCVKNNVSKKDDGHSNVRAVAYELAVLCREKGVQVNSIANASIPLVLQNRAHKNTK
jgi:hypothetical protein